MTKSGQPGTDATHRKVLSQEIDPDIQQVGNSETQGFLRGAISAFILFHLIAIACWTIPSDFSPVKDVKELVRPYMIWSGLFQSWDFFAPNPKAINSFIEAVAITGNREQKVWVFPRMEQLSFGARYRKERYRKFAEVLPLRNNADLWPGVATHVAGMFDSQTDPPQMVLLIQFQAPIKPGPRNVPEPILKPNIFYEYANVEPEVLK